MQKKFDELKAAQEAQQAKLAAAEAARLEKLAAAERTRSGQSTASDAGNSQGDSSAPAADPPAQPTTDGGGGGGGGATTPPTPSGPGAVTIAATPWCNVSIDGRAVGETPVVNHALPSGRHTITCTNPELSVTRTRSVEIRAGETERVRIDLQ